ncbi:MAG TPA: type 1 glutamine amidotransferase [Mycobacteriales bacterium]|jgi:GMP synthase-like glutamine amidotransferase|nr:type 1 glutamine amidotransferase [Mycobacteriales bacterium]
MARALVVQHTPSEGLGWLQEWLPDAGVHVHPIHPYLGHRVPPSVEGDALVVLGGPMGATDDEVAPWLPSVRSLLATAIDDGVPTLGICLGAQMLATAAGGEVSRGAAGPELGYGDVSVSVSDELLTEGTLPVVQWHFDTVTRLPDDAVLLASSEQYDVQAFRVGDVAWGLQFHIEATLPMVADWASNDAEQIRTLLQRTPEDVVGGVADAQPRLLAAGELLARRFASVITG